MFLRMLLISRKPQESVGATRIEKGNHMHGPPNHTFLRFSLDFGVPRGFRPPSSLPFVRRAAGVAILSTGRPSSRQLKAAAARKGGSIPEAREAGCRAVDRRGRSRSKDERRRMIAEWGVLVAKVLPRHGVNAQLLFPSRRHQRIYQQDGVRNVVVSQTTW
jgi:hypothetical protein